MPLDNMNANFIGPGGGGPSFEPQRANMAVCFFTGLPGASGAKDDILKLSIRNFSLPKVSNGVIEIGYLNETRKFAGKPVYENISATFVDYVDAGSAASLWAWRRLVHDPVTGKTGLAASYKKPGHMILYGPDGNFDRQYDLVGCWLDNLDPGDIDYQGEDAVSLSITLVIDKFYPVFTGIAP